MRAHTELNLSRAVSLSFHNVKQTVELISYHDLESFQWMAKQETAK